MKIFTLVELTLLLGRSQSSDNFVTLSKDIRECHAAKSFSLLRNIVQSTEIQCAAECLSWRDPPNIIGYNSTSGLCTCYKLASRPFLDLPDDLPEAGDVTFRVNRNLLRSMTSEEAGPCRALQCGTNSLCDVANSTCNCRSGYESATGDGRWCTDVDECEDESFHCEQATCMNYPGSFSCDCLEGYRVDVSGLCTDVDECQTEEDACVASSEFLRHPQCVNIEGDFLCSGSVKFNEVNGSAEDVSNLNDELLSSCFVADSSTEPWAELEVGIAVELSGVSIYSSSAALDNSPEYKELMRLAPSDVHLSSSSGNSPEDYIAILSDQDKASCAVTSVHAQSFKSGIDLFFPVNYRVAKVRLQSGPQDMLGGAAIEVCGAGGCQTCTPAPQDVQASSWYESDCNFILGSWLVISRDTQLEICELEVFGIPADESIRCLEVVDFATVATLAVKYNAIPQNAFDGTCSGTFISGDSTGDGGWFSAWTPDSFRAFKVLIQGNAAMSAAQYLGEVEVHVCTDGEHCQQCEHVGASVASEWTQVECGMKQGNSILIKRISTDGVFAFCELRVIGYRVDAGSVVRVELTDAAASSRLSEYKDPSHAIDRLTGTYSDSSASRRCYMGHADDDTAGRAWLEMLAQQTFIVTHVWVQAITRVDNRNEAHRLSLTDVLVCQGSESCTPCGRTPVIPSDNVYNWYLVTCPADLVGNMVRLVREGGRLDTCEVYVYGHEDTRHQPNAQRIQIDAMHFTSDHFSTTGELTDEGYVLPGCHKFLGSDPDPRAEFWLREAAFIYWVQLKSALSEVTGTQTIEVEMCLSSASGVQCSLCGSVQAETANWYRVNCNSQPANIIRLSRTPDRIQLCDIRVFGAPATGVSGHIPRLLPIAGDNWPSLYLRRTALDGDSNTSFKQGTGGSPSVEFTLQETYFVYSMLLKSPYNKNGQLTGATVSVVEDGGGSHECGTLQSATRVWSLAHCGNQPGSRVVITKGAGLLNFALVKVYGVPLGGGEAERRVEVESAGLVSGESCDSRMVDVLKDGKSVAEDTCFCLQGGGAVRLAFTDSLITRVMLKAYNESGYLVGTEVSVMNSLSDEAGGSSCGAVASQVAPHTWHEVVCQPGPAAGNTLLVSRAQGLLHLCEVKLFGRPIPEEYPYRRLQPFSIAMSPPTAYNISDELVTGLEQFETESVGGSANLYLSFGGPPRVVVAARLMATTSESIGSMSGTKVETCMFPCLSYHLCGSIDQDLTLGEPWDIDCHGATANVVRISRQGAITLDALQIIALPAEDSDLPRAHRRADRVADKISMAGAAPVDSDHTVANLMDADVASRYTSAGDSGWVRLNLQPGSLTHHLMIFTDDTVGLQVSSCSSFSGCQECPAKYDQQAGSFWYLYNCPPVYSDFVRIISTSKPLRLAEILIFISTPSEELPFTLPNVATTRQEAAEACASYGGTLPMYTSQEELGLLGGNGAWTLWERTGDKWLTPDGYWSLDQFNNIQWAEESDESAESLMVNADAQFQRASSNPSGSLNCVSPYEKPSLPLLFHSKMNFNKAEALCAELGGLLPTFADVEMDGLSDLLRPEMLTAWKRGDSGFTAYNATVMLEQFSELTLEEEPALDCVKMVYHNDTSARVLMSADCENTQHWFICNAQQEALNGPTAVGACVGESCGQCGLAERPVVDAWNPVNCSALATSVKITSPAPEGVMALCGVSAEGAIRGSLLSAIVLSSEFSSVSTDAFSLSVTFQGTADSILVQLDCNTCSPQVEETSYDTEKSFPFTDLTPGTLYSVTLLLKRAGEGYVLEKQFELEQATALLPPNDPVVEVASTSIELSWSQEGVAADGWVVAELTGGHRCSLDVTCRAFQPGFTLAPLTPGQIYSIGIYSESHAIRSQQALTVNTPTYPDDSAISFPAVTSSSVTVRVDTAGTGSSIAVTLSGQSTGGHQPPSARGDFAPSAEFSIDALTPGETYLAVVETSSLGSAPLKTTTNASVTLIPGTPSALNTQLLDPTTSARVSWAAPPGVVSSYFLSYGLHNMTEVEVPATDHWYLLDGLEPNERYSIRLVAQSEDKSSQPIKTKLCTFHVSPPTIVFEEIAYNSFEFEVEGTTELSVLKVAISSGDQCVYPEFCDVEATVRHSLQVLPETDYTVYFTSTDCSAESEALELNFTTPHSPPASPELDGVSTTTSDVTIHLRVSGISHALHYTAPWCTDRDTCSSPGEELRFDAGADGLKPGMQYTVSIWTRRTAYYSLQPLEVTFAMEPLPPVISIDWSARDEARIGFQLSGTGSDSVLVLVDGQVWAQQSEACDPAADRCVGYLLLLGLGTCYSHSVQGVSLSHGKSSAMSNRVTASFCA